VPRGSQRPKTWGRELIRFRPRSPMVQPNLVRLQGPLSTIAREVSQAVVSAVLNHTQYEKELVGDRLFFQPSAWD